MLLLFFNKNKVKGNVDITNNVYKNYRGHPGFITKCLETGELFETQGEAARNFNIPEIVMSNHLRDKLPDAKGLHFERVGLIS